MTKSEWRVNDETAMTKQRAQRGGFSSFVIVFSLVIRASPFVIARRVS